MRQTAEIILASVAVAAIAFSIGKCGRVPASDVTVREARAAEQAFREAEAEFAARGAEVETITVRVTTQGRNIDRVVNIVDSVIIDTTADVAALRGTLVLLRTEVVAYRVTVDSLIISHLTYRQAAERALALADSSIAGWTAAYEAEKARRWRYRGEGLLGGIGVAALLIVLAP